VKLYIWNYVTLVTKSYHDGGSVIAIAETEERAKELVAHVVKDFCDVEPLVFDLTSEMWDVFANEGCC